jgi:hypothetical protein
MRLTDEQKQAFFTSSDLNLLSQEGIDVNDPSVEVMANFQATDSEGKDHFYVAVIPIERIQGAIFQMTRLVKYLPVKHGQLRLQLSATGRPVVLIDQTKPEMNREMKELHDDIILTISGVRPIDHEEPYSAFKGLRPGYYAEEFQIGSNQSLTLNWIRDAKLSTNEYKLNITKEQAQQSLRVALTLATENGVTKSYSTLTSSCLNIAFLVMHGAMKTSDKGLWRKLAQSVAPLTSLKVRHLINFDGSSYIDTLPLGTRLDPAKVMADDDK